MLGQLTRGEIESQPNVWRSVLSSWPIIAKELAAWRDRLAATQLVFTGCGTTYALGLSSAAHFHHYGISAQAYPASELAAYPEMLPSTATTLVAISRSGSTSETLWAVEAFKKRLPGSLVVAITTQPVSPLAKIADIVLDASAAGENSVVETRSFTSMLLLSRELAAFLGRDPGLHNRLMRLPSILEGLNQRSKDKMQILGEDMRLQRFFFLGGGSMYGVAMEGMYKIKQLTAGWAEAYHPLEFRHGPITLAGPGALMVGLVADRAAGETLHLLRELQAGGAHCLAVVDNSDILGINGIENVVELKSNLNEWERAALVLPPLHWLAFQRALQLGRDPDRPAGLQAITLL